MFATPILHFVPSNETTSVMRVEQVDTFATPILPVQPSNETTLGNIDDIY
jgi:hypothetical protein